MSLSGNLGFVSLDEVLRLLIRSGQVGSVAVRGDGINGRVFVTKGGIGLATTSDDEGLRTLLVKSDLVEHAELDSGDSAVSKDDNDLVDLLREVTVESIYRLGLHGASFEVFEGQESRYASPKPFELEHLLDDAKKRLNDWAEVSKVVPDLANRVHFERDLGEREEVKIRRDAWRVLSEVGSGASVTQIAEELGTTEFWTARIVASLMEDELLTADEETAETEPPTWEEPAADTAVTEEEPVRQEDSYEDAYGEAHETEEVFEQAEPVAEEPIEEPAAIEETEAVDEPTAAETSPVDERVDPDESWWEEPEDETSDEASGDVEEDTEAFLEKVFSELETPTEEEEEGYGLLRRRRLGAIRDLTSGDS